MHIAIIDDLTEDRLLLHQLLDTYFSSPPTVYFISEYASAEELLENFVPLCFDIIFMDIYMRNLTGFDAARKIYELDPLCKIIFLTSTPEYGALSYSIHARDYILKPISLELLNRSLSRCYRRQDHPLTTYTFTYNRKPLSLNLEDIFYIDRIKRIVTLHLNADSHPVSGSFNEITSPLLINSYFVICYRSILVNISHIQLITKDSILLKNNEQIPVSRNYHQQVEIAFLRHTTELIHHQFKN